MWQDIQYQSEEESDPLRYMHGNIEMALASTSGVDLADYCGLPLPFANRPCVNR
jgi:hypothetical protein